MPRVGSLTAAACAGVMIGLYYGSINFTLGYLGGIKAFTAAVLGGIGNVAGSVTGALLLIVVPLVALLALHPHCKTPNSRITNRTTFSTTATALAEREAPPRLL